MHVHVTLTHTHVHVHVPKHVTYTFHMSHDMRMCMHTYIIYHVPLHVTEGELRPAAGLLSDGVDLEAHLVRVRGRVRGRGRLSDGVEREAHGAAQTDQAEPWG